MMRKLPSIRIPKRPITEKSVPAKVDPKPVNPILDTVRDVTDTQGNVIFTGTLRQWQKWAREREDRVRASYGLPPKEALTDRLRRKRDTSDQLPR
jgi:hypothetical protein